MGPGYSRIRSPCCEQPLPVPVPVSVPAFPCFPVAPYGRGQRVGLATVDARTYGVPFVSKLRPILANIYETHRCLLNIASLMPYLVNINPPVSNFHAIFSKHASPRNARMRCLANIVSKCTDAMFSKHRLEVHSCDIYSVSTPHETRRYI